MCRNPHRMCSLRGQSGAMRCAAPPLSLMPPQFSRAALLSHRGNVPRRRNRHRKRGMRLGLGARRNILREAYQTTGQNPARGVDAHPRCALPGVATTSSSSVTRNPPIQIPVAHSPTHPHPTPVISHLSPPTSDIPLLTSQSPPHSTGTDSPRTRITGHFPNAHHAPLLPDAPILYHATLFRSDGCFPRQSWPIVSWWHAQRQVNRSPI